MQRAEQVKASGCYERLGRKLSAFCLRHRRPQVVFSLAVVTVVILIGLWSCIRPRASICPRRRRRRLAAAGSPGGVRRAGRLTVLVAAQAPLNLFGAGFLGCAADWPALGRFSQDPANFISVASIFRFRV